MKLNVIQSMGARLLAGLLVASAGTPARAMFPPPPPPPEPAAAKEVDALNAAAVEKFQAKEYDEAARLFEEAYAISPEPNYLFNIGRVFEEKGDLRSAVAYYERFMNEPGVKIEAREIALERVRVLKEIIRENDTKEAADAAAEEDAATPEPSPLDDKTGKPMPPMRVAGIALLAVGGAVLAAGAGFGGAAAAKSNDLDDLNTLEPRDDAIEKGKRNAIIADSFFIGGGALALTGLVLTVVSFTKKDARSQRASVAPSLTRHHAGMTARFRF